MSFLVASWFGYGPYTLSVQHCSTLQRLFCHGQLSKFRLCIRYPDGQWIYPGSLRRCYTLLWRRSNHHLTLRNYWTWLDEYIHRPRTGQTCTGHRQSTGCPLRCIHPRHRCRLWCKLCRRHTPNFDTWQQCIRCSCTIQVRTPWSSVCILCVCNRRGDRPHCCTRHHCTEYHWDPGWRHMCCPCILHCCMRYCCNRLNHSTRLRMGRNNCNRHR